MKKILKVLLIILIYILMFWGLISLFKHIIHKDCECIDIRKIEVVPVQKIELKINKRPGVETKEEYLAKKKAEEETRKKAEEEKKKKKAEAKKKKQTTSKSGNKDTYKKYAHDLVINKYNWSENDYNALVKLWTKESNWNPNAVNKKSGACNIPQAMPCSKIAKKYGNNSWQSGIKWGLEYIKSRYGSPSKAWQHFQNKGWY